MGNIVVKLDCDLKVHVTKCDFALERVSEALSLSCMCTI